MTAPTGGWPSPAASLAIAAATTVAVSLLSAYAPEEYANTLVGMAFLAATWWVALRSDTDTVRAYGLGLAGLTEPEPLEPRRIARAMVTALGWALAMAAIFYVPFWLGYRWWWELKGGFRVLFPPDIAGHVMGQLLVIALPEEAFYRGFLQSALDGAWSSRRVRLFGAELGPGWLLSAAIFALGHYLTIQSPARLGVFFPALLFGWLRARTGGIGASVLFHAMCNLFSAGLARGYGLG